MEQNEKKRTKEEKDYNNHRCTSIRLAIDNIFSSIAKINGIPTTTKSKCECHEF
jgi:hypothetical protein